MAEDSMAFGPLIIWYDASGLRPREWTQMQAAWAAELLARLPDGDVLELCAGTGQIGLLALVEADRAGGADPAASRRLVQVEQGETVCALARRNAELAGLAERVDIRNAPVERSLGPDAHFVLVIADPPWVPSHRVGDYPEDPPSAIDGGSDGLDVVRALLPVVEHHLHPAGLALLQVGGADQVNRVRSFLRSNGSALYVIETREAPNGEHGAVALLAHRQQ